MFASTPVANMETMQSDIVSQSRETCLLGWKWFCFCIIEWFILDKLSNLINFQQDFLFFTILNLSVVTSWWFIIHHPSRITTPSESDLRPFSTTRLAQDRDINEIERRFPKALRKQSDRILLPLFFLLGYTLQWTNNKSTCVRTETGWSDIMAMTPTRMQICHHQHRVTRYRPTTHGHHTFVGW